MENPLQMHEAAIVQICKAGGQIVGVGFAVTKRHILTCAHVVNVALNQKKEDHTQPSEEVTITFPFLNEASTTAKIVYWKPPQSARIVEEDIAGLELTAPVFNLKPVHIGDFREAGSKFTAFGYPADRPKDTGVWADGEIKDSVSPGWVQIEGTYSQGRRVEQGFSGTAVWNQAKSTVLGMVVAEYTEDETAKVAYMIPSQILKKAIAHLKLHDILIPSNGDSLTPEIWKIYEKAFKACCPEGWLEDFPKTLDDIMRQLQDMLPHDVNFGKLPEFIAWLIVDSDRKLSEHQYEKLNKWANDSELKNFVDLRERVKKQQYQLFQESKTSAPYLIFEVSPSRNTQGEYNTQAFFVPDINEFNPPNIEGYSKEKPPGYELLRATEVNTPCSSENLHNSLRLYVESCLDKYEVEENLTVVVFLPLELIHLEVDRWRVPFRFGERILGSEFTVLIRLQNRITEYKRSDKTRWRKRWQQLQQSCGERACDRLAEAKSGEPYNQLNARLEMKKAVGFRLKEVPQESAKQGFFQGLLGTAAPIAIWLRSAPQSTENDTARGILECLNPLLGCCLHKVPIDVRAARNEAVARSPDPDEQDFHIGYHISLLWEDPNLIPPNEKCQTQ